MVPPQLNPPPRMAAVAASIVTYLTPADEIARCIDTLLLSDIVARIDIIDNSRADYIRDLAFSYKDSRVRYTANDNTGYGAANNISLRRSLTDSNISYHLVMNSDIIFDPAVIESLTGIMDADETIALTIPRITDRDGIEQSSYHPVPSVADFICRRYVPRRLCRRRMERYEIKVSGMKEPLNVPYVHGCFMMMRVDALREVGLFDERFFMYPEDIDLTRRLHKRFKTLVIPQLSIIHDHRAASRKSLRMFAVHVFNMVKYFNKWGWKLL